MMKIKQFICVVIVFNLCEVAIASDVAKAFFDNEVVPDVVNVAPQEEITVTYPNGVSVDFGNEITPSEVKNVPKVEWNADPNQLYTLLMVDPDAPSRDKPTFRSFKHWAVINIPGADVGKGDEITEYIGAGPPNGTGLHRYVFLIYKQSAGRITYEGPIVSNKSRIDRPKFSALNFANNFNLGNPIAGNFFQAKYDEYVPILHAQLSGK